MSKLAESDHQSNKKMSSEEEIKYELERSLLEWGIDATRGGKRHVEFYRASMKQVISQYSQIEDESHQQQSDQCVIGTFDSSVDVFGAVQQLIDAKFMHLVRRSKDDTTVVEDMLVTKDEADLGREGHGSWLYLVPPYLVKYDRHWKVATQSSHYKIKYEVKKEFASFKRADLDPFERFLQKDSLSFADYCFTTLMDRVVDITFEAYVCHHIINKEACRSCHNRHSFQWNEAVNGWGHIECEGCGSKYTVQSHALRVKGISSQKRIEGGKFSAFHTNRRKTREQSSTSKQPNEHHYLIFSSQESLSALRAVGILPSSDRQEQSLHVPVLIAEIDSCLPRCVPESFSSLKSGRTSIEMYSWIKQVPKSRRIWFHLVIDDVIDVEEMIQNVFEQEFSRDEWDRLMVVYQSKKAAANDAPVYDDKQQEDYGEFDEYDDASSTQDQADQHHPLNAIVTKTLKTELDQLRKDDSDSDADWENAYDSA